MTVPTQTIDAQEGETGQGINEEGQIVGFYTVSVAKTVDPTGSLPRAFSGKPDATFSSIQFPLIQTTRWP